MRPQWKNLLRTALTTNLLNLVDTTESSACRAIYIDFLQKEIWAQPTHRGQGISIKGENAR